MFQRKKVPQKACKSNFLNLHDDLNRHILKVGDTYDWEFNENLWHTTRFWCSFASQNGHLTFDVFWPERSNAWLADRCVLGDCTWIARDDGFYIKNDTGKKLELVHKWSG